MVLLSGDGKGAGGPAPGRQLLVPPGGPAGGAGAEGGPPARLSPAGARGEEDDDYEEYDDFSELPDTRSIASDDSFYPPRAEGDDDEGDDDWSLGESDPSDSPEPVSLFRACCTNNVAAVRALLRQGPEEEDVRETDRNKRVRKEGARAETRLGGAFEGTASWPFPPLSTAPPSSTGLS